MKLYKVFGTNYDQPVDKLRWWYNRLPTLYVEAINVDDAITIARSINKWYDGAQKCTEQEIMDYDGPIVQMTTNAHVIIATCP